MTDLLQEGLGYLADALEAHASSSITYARTGQTSITMTATHGRREYDVIDGATVTRVVVTAFRFKASALNFGAGAVDPKKNDTITATVSGQSRTYQVLEVGGHAFEKDPYGIMLRVNTKEIG